MLILLVKKGKLAQFFNFRKFKSSTNIKCKSLKEMMYLGMLCIKEKNVHISLFLYYNKP